MRSGLGWLNVIISVVPILLWQLQPWPGNEISQSFLLGPTPILAQTLNGENTEGIPKLGLITKFGCCGRSEECLPGNRAAQWGAFGTREELVAKSGERLRLTCEDAELPFFLLLYTRPGGEEFHVGICPFAGGCNTARFLFMLDGIAGVDSAPDRFSGTFWRSKDFGENDDETFNAWTKKTDPDENLLDWAELSFNAATQNLDKNSLKWEYRIGPPVFGCSTPFRPEGDLISQAQVDPPLGPESEAFFNEVERDLQVLNPSDNMREDTSVPCDLNNDGFCDDMDFKTFSLSLGTCRGDSLYNPDADLDGNGCIGSLDRYYLYEQDSDRDGIPDLQTKTGVE